MRAFAFSILLISACGSSPAKPTSAGEAHESGEKEEHEEKIALDAVPAPVTQAMMARYPDAKLHKAEKVTGSDQSVAYEVGFETAAGWKEATFKADGTFIEEE